MYLNILLENIGKHTNLKFTATPNGFSEDQRGFLSLHVQVTFSQRTESVNFLTLGLDCKAYFHTISACALNSWNHFFKLSNLNSPTCQLNKLERKIYSTTHCLTIRIFIFKLTTQFMPPFACQIFRNQASLFL